MIRAVTSSGKCSAIRSMTSRSRRAFGSITSSKSAGSFPAATAARVSSSTVQISAPLRIEIRPSFVPSGSRSSTCGTPRLRACANSASAAARTAWYALNASSLRAARMATSSAARASAGSTGVSAGAVVSEATGHLADLDAAPLELHLDRPQRRQKRALGLAQVGDAVALPGGGPLPGTGELPAVERVDAEVVPLGAGLTFGAAVVQDLLLAVAGQALVVVVAHAGTPFSSARRARTSSVSSPPAAAGMGCRPTPAPRSRKHTSLIQSRPNLV